MKDFLKNVLANITAILLVFAGGFFLMILFFAIAMMAGESKTIVKRNSVLTLDFRTNIIDSPSEDQEGILGMNKKQKNVLLYDILKAIEKAKTDDNIKGISIETDNLNAGITQIDDIRAALEDFKKSGKFVYAYGNTVTQPSYYLGSVADKYVLNPAGGIELKGMSTEVVYLKNFTEKYGIGTEVIRHGKYKSAVEPFLRNDISAENKEQLSTLLNDIWGNISAKMAASRKINPAEFQKITDSLYGIIPELSLKNRLADQLLQKSQYDDLLKQKLHVGKDEDLNKIGFQKYSAAEAEKFSTGGRVAVLYASGEISDGEGYDGIHSKNYIKQIKDLAEDNDVKAVVLRINSPGGSANASDEILFELQQLKAKKPLVVSFGDYAASGGYYMAMGADKIFTEKNTLTGSIGVFGVIFNGKELAARNGIRADVVKTNENSNMVSALNGVSPGALNMLTKNVEQTYKRFVYFVTKNRNKSFEQIDAIGGGRVWSGTRAKDLGLADSYGTLQDAINFAAKSAKINDYSVASYPKKRNPIQELFQDLDEDEISAKIIRYKIGAENYRLMEYFMDRKTQSPILMQSPYSISFK